MSNEREVKVLKGWLMLPFAIALYIAGPLCITLAFLSGQTNAEGGTEPLWVLFAAGIVLVGLAVLGSFGFFTLQPNEARLLILFGDYRGTARRGGFCWGNPFYANGPAGQGGKSWGQR